MRSASAAFPALTSTRAARTSSARSFGAARRQVSMWARAASRFLLAISVAMSPDRASMACGASRTASSNAARAAEYCLRSSATHPISSKTNRAKARGSQQRRIATMRIVVDLPAPLGPGSRARSRARPGSDAVDGPDRAEALAQVLDLDHGGHRASSVVIWLGESQPDPPPPGPRALARQRPSAEGSRRLWGEGSNCWGGPGQASGPRRRASPARRGTALRIRGPGVGDRLAGMAGRQPGGLPRATPRAAARGRVVLEALDVVLAEIRPPLDLDEGDRDPAGVLDAVGGARAGCPSCSPATSSTTSPSSVTSRSAATTIQCSARLLVPLVAQPLPRPRPRCA